MAGQSSSHQLGPVRKQVQRQMCRCMLQAAVRDQHQGMAAGKGLLTLLYSVVSSGTVLGTWATG